MYYNITFLLILRAALAHCGMYPYMNTLSLADEYVIVGG